MSRILLNVNQQPKIFTVAGEKPTVPSPSTAIPTDSTWTGTDIMIGETAYNSADDIYYYRDANDAILELTNASNFESNFKTYSLDATIRTITDGPTPSVDFESWGQRIFKHTTSESTPTVSISNFGLGGQINIKKAITGDTTYTLSGTGLKFYDMDDKASGIQTNVGISLSNATLNTVFEINLIDSGFTDSGSRVINVKLQ